MTETNTRTATTAHGDVEYETLECDSCGSEMLKEDANDFTIGGRDGVACDFCVEEGPSSFPGPELIQVDGFILGVLFSPLIFAYSVRAGVIRDDHSLQAFAGGFIGALFWSVILIGGVVVLLL